MFCPECGTNLPDGSTFCTNCGKQLAQQMQFQPPVQPQYQAPVQPQYQAPVQPQQQPQPPRPTIDPEAMSKTEFIKQCGDKKVRTTALFATIAMLVVLGLLAGSIFVMLNMSLFKIPLVYNGFKLINDLGVEEIDVDTLEPELRDMLRSLRGDYLILRNEMTPAQREATEVFLDAVDKFAENPSILAGRACLKELEDTRSFGIFGAAIESGRADTFYYAGKGVETVAGIMIGCFFLPLLFTLLGGFRKSTGLSVAALIFTLITQLLWVGLIFAGVTFAVLLTQCILCRKLTKAQMAYRWSFRT